MKYASVSEECEAKEQIEFWQAPPLDDERTKHSATEEYEKSRPGDVRADQSESRVHPPLTKCDGCEYAETHETKPESASYH